MLIELIAKIWRHAHKLITRWRRARIELIATMVTCSQAGRRWRHAHRADRGVGDMLIELIAKIWRHAHRAGREDGDMLIELIAKMATCSQADREDGDMLTS